MIPAVENISFEVSDNLKIPEYYIEEKVTGDLMLRIKDYVSVEYWESVNAESTRVVARVAVMTLEERSNLIRYIERLEKENEHMLNIINLKGVV